MKDVSNAPLRSRALLLLPIFMLLAALTLNVVSLSIPRWVNYQVDDSMAAVATSLDYYSRTRGVFLTCLVSSKSALLTWANISTDVKYDSCVEMDFGNLTPERVGYIGPGAMMLITLRRLHLALHLAAGFFLCLGLITCLVSCSCCVTRRASIGMFVTAAFAIIAAGFQFGAQVVFMNLMLREALPASNGTTAATKTNIFNAWPGALQLATQVSLDASYYIALASFGASLASGTSGMVCAASLAFKLQHQQPSPPTEHTAFPADPTGSTSKTNGDTTRMDNFSNLSATRLPRISVHTNLGYTPY